MAITFKKKGLGWPTQYDVLLDGEKIGTVTKFERRVNLRRVTVQRGWRARALDGFKLYHDLGSTSPTRAKAADTLRVYHEEQRRKSADHQS